jgi:hypothetical protein
VECFSYLPGYRLGLQVVRQFWTKNDAKGAVEAMKKMTDHSVMIFTSGLYCHWLFHLSNGLLVLAA